MHIYTYFYADQIWKEILFTVRQQYSLVPRPPQIYNATSDLKAGFRSHD